MGRLWILAGAVVAVAVGLPHHGAIADDGARSSTALPAGPNWVDVGQPVKASRSLFTDVDASRHALTPSLVFTNALPSLGWIELNAHGIPQIHFGHWSRSGWMKDGGAQNMDAAHRTFDLTISSNGKIPYLAWIELNANDIPQLYIKHLMGDLWITDGESLNLDPAHRAANPALSAAGPTPYVAWCEYGVDRIYQLHVKYLTEDGWHAAGSESLNISPTRDAIEPAIVFLGSVPHVTWAELSDHNFYQIYVKRWNGSAWEKLGQSLNLDPENHALNPSIAVLGETLYVSWIEINGKGVSQLQVKRWESGAWVADGTSLNRDPTRHALSPSLAQAGPTLYLAWTEYNAKGVTQIHISHRVGDRWESDDPRLNAAPLTASSAPALAGSDTAVYIAWKEVYQNGLAQIVVKRLQTP
ncbi:MAG: hypothetical protein HY283_04745 [Nitrospirae bacterium]|nr:hypothetical protein [Nitrospirota bacterium]